MVERTVWGWSAAEPAMVARHRIARAGEHALLQPALITTVAWRSDAGGAGAFATT